MELNDRVALITGASGGLGAVTARMLADRGVHVAVTHLGLVPAGSIALAVSKAGLIHLTRCLAVALAPSSPSTPLRLA